jgi:hypothetical protein
LIEKYRQVDRLIEQLELTDYEVNNVDEAIRDLESLKDKVQSEKFATHQQNIKLEYENDHFKILVPLSRADLAFYGSYFHNCLNGYEWNNYLSNGRRYVVIVLDKKDQNSPVVCADIDSYDNDIHQYLAKYNNNVTDEEQIEFRGEYQQYLKKLQRKTGE